LGKITRNLSINKYKEKHRQKRGSGRVELALAELEECIPGGTEVEQEIENAVVVQALNKFLIRLPREKRSIFIRRYFDLNSINEIADMYNISDSKITTTLFRTRRELKHYLEKEALGHERGAIIGLHGHDRRYACSRRRRKTAG